MPLDRDIVAANVRAEMARGKVGRAEVATAIGIGYQALQRRLHGEVAFNVDEIAAVARILDVPVDRLMTTDNIAIGRTA